MGVFLWVRYPCRPRPGCLSQARPLDTACLLYDAAYPCNIQRASDKRSVSTQRVTPTFLLTEVRSSLQYAVLKVCVKSLEMTCPLSQKGLALHLLEAALYRSLALLRSMFLLSPIWSARLVSAPKLTNLYGKKIVAMNSLHRASTALCVLEVLFHVPVSLGFSYRRVQVISYSACTCKSTWAARDYM